MNTIVRFVIGLFLLVAVVVVGSAKTTTVYAQDAQEQIIKGLCTGANLQFTDNPTNDCKGPNDATAKVNKVIHSIINFLSIIVGVVAVIMIIIGGLRYITSGGSDTGVTSAKNTILYAIIGLIIVAFAQILTRFVLKEVTG